MTDDRAGDDVEQLLQRAGARTLVAADRTARVKAIVHEAWIERSRARRRRRAAIGIVTVLGAAAALTIAVRLRQPDAGRAPTAAAPAARVVTVAGTVSADGSTLHAGDAIAGGAAIRVAADAVASLSLAGGAELRLDRGTAIVIDGQRELTLRGGAVYVNTGRSVLRAPVVVRTVYGDVRDIGTRFEVRVLQDACRARVRDGVIRIDAGGATRRGSAGREVTMRADGTAIEGAVAPDDDGWNWITRAGRPFVIEGVALREFLRWASDESGRDIRFVDSETERAFASTTLHGAIDGLTIDQALDVVLPACGLVRETAQGQVIVSRSKGRE